MANEPYQVTLLRTAEKDLRRLRGLKDRAVEALLRLKAEPAAGHLLSGDLAGYRSLEFSMPGGAYRAVYYVDDEARSCVVFIVGPHEGIYQRAARRARSLGR
jgi:mRNA-degrading endonuclease RelE of RelBE toxin-antitoxin system